MVEDLLVLLLIFDLCWFVWFEVVGWFWVWLSFVVICFLNYEFEVCVVV